VSVGTDHDTAEFAVTIATWWQFENPCTSTLPA
jgi:hypothetical protein